MKRINLLPPEQGVKASRERGLMYVVVFLVAVVVALGLVYFQQRNQVSGKQEELAGLQAQTAAVEAQIAALQPYAQIEAARTTMTQTTQGIYTSRVYWSTIFEQVSLVIPDNVRLTTMNCVVPPAMLPSEQSEGAAAAAGAADVTFTGLTYTPDDVATFMTRLGLIPQLSNIQLTSSTRSAATTTSTSSTSTATPVPTATAYRWQFTVTATLRPYLTAPPTTSIMEAAQ
jgi:Tfp pilus assembly protein PilN